jgi:hypothetical protein
MNADPPIPPKYNPILVGQVILLEIIDRHPASRTADQLICTIILDSDDDREVEVASAAIREMGRVGLVRYRSDGEPVEATPAALHAHALLVQ